MRYRTCVRLAPPESKLSLFVGEAAAPRTTGRPWDRKSKTQVKPLRPRQLVNRKMVGRDECEN